MTGNAAGQAPVYRSRKLSSWTDGFQKYTEHCGSPAPFRKWAGIFAIASVLERKVHLITKKGPTFPNIYAILVGPPGAGKTIATSMAHELIAGLKDHHLSPTSVTKASLIDALKDAERKIVRPTQDPPILSFNALTVISNELGVLLPSYEADFMNTLTDLWDCKIYSESRRSTKTNFKIEAPCLNIIAATTPSYLNGFLPEGAWDQGFLARTILVYSGANPPSTIFHEENIQDKVLWEALQEDLKIIGSLSGKFTFSAEAAAAITGWALAGCPPVPDHPKLNNYNVRRVHQLLKLCMIASASSSNDLVVELEHYAEALDWLIEVEHSIPDIFKSMTTGGDGRVMEECYYFAYNIWIKEQKPIHEHRIVNFLQEKTPAHNVMRILEIMVKGKLLEEQLTPAGRAFRPKAKKV